MPDTTGLHSDGYFAPAFPVTFQRTVFALSLAYAAMPCPLYWFGSGTSFDRRGSDNALRVSIIGLLGVALFFPLNSYVEICADTALVYFLLLLFR